MSGSCLGKNNTCETESKEEENDSNQIKLDDNNFIGSMCRLIFE